MKRKKGGIFFSIFRNLVLLSHLLILIPLFLFLLLLLGPDFGFNLLPPPPPLLPLLLHPRLDRSVLV